MSKSGYLFSLFLLLLLLMPVGALVWQDLLVLPSSFQQLTIYLTIVFGLIYIGSKKELEVPLFYFLLPLYFIYRVIVDMQYHTFVEGNLHKSLQLNSFSLAIFFGLIMIDNTLINKEISERVLKWFKWIILITPIISLYQVFKPTFLAYAPQENYGEYVEYIYKVRRNAFFAFEDRNALGLTFLPIAATFVGVQIHKEEKQWIWFYLVLIGLVSVLSNTRYVMFGFFLLTLQVIYGSKNKFTGIVQYLLVLTFFVVVVLMTLNVVGYDFTAFFEERLGEGPLQESDRYVSYLAFLEVYPNYPFFGTGAVDAIEITKALKGGSPSLHIGFLEHLTAYGLIGSFLLFFFWFKLAFNLFTSAKRTGFYGAFFAIVIFLWANMTLKVYSLFFSGILLSLIFDRYFKNQQEVK
jgi:hypothetical protein